MKFDVDEDEAYPVFSIKPLHKVEARVRHRVEQNGSYIALTRQEAADFKRAASAFWKWQDRIAELLDEAHQARRQRQRIQRRRAP